VFWQQPKAFRIRHCFGLLVLRCVACLLACVWALVDSPTAKAQELEPRGYSPSPTGANFLVLAFGRISGSVEFDPTLPITGVHGTLYSPVVGLGRTFGLFGRQALVTTALPYAWGNIQGAIYEQQRSAYRSGLADSRFKFSLNLRGSPALSPQAFAASAKSRRRRLIVGTSLAVVAPTGQYDKTKLINLGAGRWAFKPELGTSYQLKNWDFDFYTGVWLFSENRAFFPGNVTRRQNPLPALQAHVSYSLRQHMWAAFDSTWYGGGASSLNNGPPTSRLNNSRVGTTLSIPLGTRQSLKISYSRGATARTGANFSALGVAWQFLWFDRR